MAVFYGLDWRDKMLYIWTTPLVRRGGVLVIAWRNSELSASIAITLFSRRMSACRALRSAGAAFHCLARAFCCVGLKGINTMIIRLRWKRSGPIPLGKLSNWPACWKRTKRR